MVRDLVKRSNASSNCPWTIELSDRVVSQLLVRLRGPFLQFKAGNVLREGDVSIAVITHDHVDRDDTVLSFVCPSHDYSTHYLLLMDDEFPPLEIPAHYWTFVLAADEIDDDFELVRGRVPRPNNYELSELGQGFQPAKCCRRCARRARIQRIAKSVRELRLGAGWLRERTTRIWSTPPLANYGDDNTLNAQEHSIVHDADLPYGWKRVFSCSLSADHVDEANLDDLISTAADLIFESNEVGTTACQELLKQFIVNARRFGRKTKAVREGIEYVLEVIRLRNRDTRSPWNERGRRRAQ